MLTSLACAVSLLLQQPGDRLFARGPTALRAQPRAEAPAVHGLRAGDELVEGDPPEQDFTVSRIPEGWRTVQTIDVPSGRVFSGFVSEQALSEDPPPPAKRIAVLHAAIEADVAALETRQAPFAALRAKVNEWHGRVGTAPEAADQLRLAQAALADYMEREVTTRALDVEDALSELRDLEDGTRVALATRFGKAAQSFRP